MTVVAERQRKEERRRKKVDMEDHDAPWTEEEFFALGETLAKVELLDGSLLVSPSPNYGHQDLARMLTNALFPAAKAAGLWIYCDVDLRLQPGLRRGRENPPGVPGGHDGQRGTGSPADL
jgi:Uma2 family endonuclease